MKTHVQETRDGLRDELPIWPFGDVAYPGCGGVVMCVEDRADNVEHRRRHAGGGGARFCRAAAMWDACVTDGQPPCGKGRPFRGVNCR